MSQNSGIFKFGYHFWRETTPDRGAPMNATAHPLVRFVLGFTYQYFLAPWAYFKSVFGLFYGIHITIFEQSGKQRGIRLYVYSGKLIFAAMYLRRVRVVSTPPMKHVSTAPRLRQKTLRGPSATLTGAGKCWYARGDGADRPTRLPEADASQHSRGDGTDYPCAPRLRSLFEGCSAFRRLFKPPDHGQRRLVVCLKARRHALRMQAGRT